MILETAQALGPFPVEAEFVVVRVGDAMTLQLLGELDFLAAPAFARLLAAVSKQAGGQLTVDLGDVSFLGSAALAVLSLSVSQRRQAGRPTWVTRAAPGVRRLAAVCGLDELLVAPPLPRPRPSLESGGEGPLRT